MALSIENIQFIDTYLKKSGVIFMDIRLEMVDHVASEIEARVHDGDLRDFYFIFKDYMVENKRHLLKRSDGYYKIADKNNLKNLYKKATSVFGIISFLSLALFLVFVRNYLEPTITHAILKYAPMALLLGFGCMYFVFTKIKKERFSLLERIGFYFIILFHVVNLVYNNYNTSETLEHNSNFTIIIFTTTVLWLFLLLVVSTWQLRSFYFSKYKYAL